MVKDRNQRHRRFEDVVDQVFEPLQMYLHRRIPGHSVDDALSETLLVVWRRLDELPAGNVLPWCYGVARNVVSNHRRGETRRLRLVEKLEAETSAHSVPDPTEGSDPDLALAIESLGPEDQELVRLWAWEELEPREIAVVLDSTPNAISLRLTRLKKKIVENLERQNRDRPGHIPGVSPDRHIG